MTRRLYVEPGDPRVRVVQPRKVVAKYNPDQARAANGEFGSGAGSVSAAVSEAKSNYTQFAPGGDPDGEKAAVKSSLRQAADWAKTGDSAFKKGDSTGAREAYQNAKASLASALSGASLNAYHPDNVDSGVRAAHDAIGRVLGN